MITKPEIVEHIMLYDVSWEAYERLLEAFGDRRFRHTYLDGALEIMSPFRHREWIKKSLARIVEAASLHLRIPIRCVGSTTLRKEIETRGLEPDECYYIQNAAQINMNKKLDLEMEPPPDLAIEVNVTHKDLNRDTVYATLGVPELWHYDYDDDAIRILILQESQYKSVDRSAAFSMFSPSVLMDFLEIAHHATSDDNQLVYEVIDWLDKNHFKKS